MFGHGKCRPRPLLYLVLAWLLAACDAATADERSLLVTAGFISKFPLFIEWPGTAAAGEFCLLGAPKLAPVLEEVLGHLDRGRAPVSHRVAADPGTLERCRVVYLGPEGRGRLAEVAEAVAGRPVLVVTRNPGAAGRGAHINLYRSRGRIRFEVNVAALERSGLRADFRLLELARIVDP